MLSDSKNEKRKSQQQELSTYLNRDLAKLKLRKTTLLHKKKLHEEQSKVWLNEKNEIEKKINELNEHINIFHTKIAAITDKITDCQGKIQYYSDLLP